MSLKLEETKIHLELDLFSDQVHSQFNNKNKKTNFQDFSIKMDFLKAEIERKKRQLAEKNVVGPNKKYFKRGELMEKEREEYFKKLKPKEEDVKYVAEINQPKEKDDKNEVQDNSDLPNLPRDEVIRRLRERLEPILLYGESENDAQIRLRSIEVNEPDKIEGIRNDFKDAMDRVEKVSDDNRAQGSSGKSASESDLYVTNISYEELKDLMKDANKGEFDADVKIVIEFIKYFMTKWAKTLESRPEDEKQSVMGKRETGIHAQTRTYLKPLLKLIKKQALTDDVRDSLVKMILFALHKDYILSHEAYMEMAVGNAPWPIGVTNAGIHARPARENIFSKNVAHVLNDETQRKYIQGLKRLITKAQEYYPTDPSKSVDFVKRD